jgi:creatinine amidohydrolase
VSLGAIHQVEGPSVAPVEVRAAHLRPADLRARRQVRSVAWLPLGTTEWHGPHLPLGVDGVKAERLCMAAAGRLGGVVFPVMWWGDHRRLVVEALLTPSSPFAPADGVDHRAAVNDALGTIESDMADQADRDDEAGASARHVDLLVQALWTIRSYGFAHIVALAGHYPIAPAAAAAADRFHAAQSECRVVAGTELAFVAPAEAAGPPRHADSFETSLMLALAPELVDLDALGHGPPVGVMGDDPRKATAAAGHRIVEQFMAAMTNRLSLNPVESL